MKAFNHENLKVYQRTLRFNSKVCAWIGQWDSQHAVCDQLSRAVGSMLENIAMASAALSAMKPRSLECAACLDLARIKRWPDADATCPEKEELSQPLRMLVGLRKILGEDDASRARGSLGIQGRIGDRQSLRQSSRQRKNHPVIPEEPSSSIIEPWRRRVLTPLWLRLWVSGQAVPLIWPVQPPTLG
jgi:hypothetical protein